MVNASPSVDMMASAFITGMGRPTCRLLSTGPECEGLLSHVGLMTAPHPSLPLARSACGRSSGAKCQVYPIAAEQQATADGWSPASYLYVLAEQEHQQRHQARQRRLLHEAQLPPLPGKMTPLQQYQYHQPGLEQTLGR